MSALDDLRAEQLHPRPVPRRTVDDDWRDLIRLIHQTILEDRKGRRR